MDDLCIPDLIMSSSHHNDQPKEIKVNHDLCPPPLYPEFPTTFFYDVYLRIYQVIDIQEKAFCRATRESSLVSRHSLHSAVLGCMPVG